MNVLSLKQIVKLMAPRIATGLFENGHRFRENLRQTMQHTGVPQNDINYARAKMGTCEPVLDLVDIPIGVVEPANRNGGREYFAKPGFDEWYQTRFGSGPAF